MGWTYAVLLLAGLTGPHSHGLTPAGLASRAAASGSYVSASGKTAIGFSRPGTETSDLISQDWLVGGLKIPGSARPLVEGMWRASPTFRRQCSRLIDARAVVTVSFDVSHATDRNAWTDVTRDAGVRAHIHLRSADARMTELFAHELEHVVEQLDGVDLSKTANRIHGATAFGRSNVFETTRAVTIGLIVAREVDAHQHGR